MKKIFLAILLTFSISGCTSTEVMPVQSTIPAKLDLKKIENAIKMGAADKRWIAKSLDNNTMELSQKSRSHLVVVTLKYDTSNYQITYKDSTNMNYEPSSNTIHRKYHKWVDGLRHAIDKHLVYQSNQ